MTDKKTGVELIAQERKEQIEKHGRTIDMDVLQNSTWPPPLTKAASSLSVEPMTEMVAVFGKPEGWDDRIWRNMCSKSYSERLAIAGALIAAEIDRLNNSENP
jgi:hypothetical protein